MGIGIILTSFRVTLLLLLLTAPLCTSGNGCWGGLGAGGFQGALVQEFGIASGI